MPAESAEPMVEVSSLNARFGRQWVLRDINLTVRHGEIVALVGGSGGGKTTLLNQVIGLLQPESGEVKVLGQNIHRLSDAERRRLCRSWGVLFQQGALFSALDVYDNIAFPVREMRKDGRVVPESEVRELVRHKLHLVGLGADDAWKQPAELSGGMNKRAALARALVLDPELMFLDEPTSGLDPISASDFESVLLELRDELRLTALMITHDLSALATLTDRIIVLDDGEIVAQGPLDEVKEVDHPFVREFFHGRRGERILGGRG
jgi:phospholipid/cholesterol/gamma-HCH transport system ATP-binding protein